MAFPPVPTVVFFVFFFRACRLKKKAQYEANKVKLWGLSTEYGWFLNLFIKHCETFSNDMLWNQRSHLSLSPSPPSDRLLFVINAIKEEIVARVEDSSPRQTNMNDTLERLIQETLGED